jgi:hypothetical protein
MSGRATAEELVIVGRRDTASQPPAGLDAHA